MNHLQSHIKHHTMRSDNTLHVIAPITNAVRYNSRYRIARDWIAHMATQKHVKLYIVEGQHGDRHCEVTAPDNPQHLQLRLNSEAWIKENQINLGVRYLLPRDWKYMAWIDMDVFFRNPNWAMESIQQLQTYEVIQPWQDCTDLGHNGRVMELHRSFGYLNRHKIRRQKKAGEPYMFAHPGFAWACTRKFWENLPGHGLFDCAILGSADHHMACAMVNEVNTSMHDKMSAAFKRRAEEWQRYAYRMTKGHIGYVPGVIEHMFHGPKKRRFYRERWDVLVGHEYNPDMDLAYDNLGVLQLVGKPGLEDDIRGYNRSRCEDSIEES